MEIPPPSATLPALPAAAGAADSLIAGERTVGNAQGGGEDVGEAEDAAAGNRTAG